MSEIQVNTINEYTGANGVTIDGALIKDSLITASAPFLHIQDRRSSGTQGGTFTSGAWRTRTLQTKPTDEIGSTLSSNQFTLPSGTYFLQAFVAGFRVDNHRSILYNITDTADTLTGSTERSDATSDTTTHSKIFGRFTISDTKTFEIRSYCQTTAATNGFGEEGGANAGSKDEVYIDVMIWKVA